MRKKVGAIVLAVLTGLLLSGIRTGYADDYSSKEDPFVIDMTEGFAWLGEGDYFKWNAAYFELRAILENFDSEKVETPFGFDTARGLKADLDGDGTKDVQFSYVGSELPYETVDGYAPSSGYMVPLPGRSIKGAFEIDGSRFGKKGYYVFLFDEAETDPEYRITVNGGHAETSYGMTITEAAPGSLVYLVPDAMEGSYITGWGTEDMPGNAARENQGAYKWDRIPFIMPAANVTYTAVTKPQEPLTIDMSDGYWLTGSRAYGITWGNADKMYPYELSLTGFGETETTDLLDYLLADLDGDGSDDVLLGYMNMDDIISGREVCSCLAIPLSGASISGTYVYQTKSTGKYWPLTFHFPQEDVKPSYRITVEGGHAEDASGKHVTEAKPGELLQILYDEREGEVFRNEIFPDKPYLKLQTYNWSGINQYIIMPACDITYTANVKKNTVLELDFVKSGDGKYWKAELPDDVYKAVEEAEKRFGSPLIAIYKWFEPFNPQQQGKTFILTTMPTIDTGERIRSMTFTLYEPLETEKDIYYAVTLRFPGTGEIYPVTCTESGAKIGEKIGGINLFSDILAANANQELCIDGSKIEAPYGYYLAGFEADGIVFTPDTFYPKTWTFVMPDHAVTIKAVFEKTEGQTATPTPTPTPAEDPAPTPSEAPTEEVPLGVNKETPAETPADNGSSAAAKEESEGGFNILYILTPAAVLLACGAIASLFIRKKKGHRSGTERRNSDRNGAKKS